MRYEYRGPGAQSVIPADVAGEELSRIASRDGSITPRAVVDEARPEDALLHPAFEWDDSVAAEQYRQEQARRLVRAVVLVSEPERNENVPTVRAFVSLHDATGEVKQARHYKPIMEVMANPIEADELKRLFRNEVLRMRERYENLLALDDNLKGAFHVLEEAVA